MKTLINWPVFHTEIWVCFWNDQVFCSWQKNYWHPVLTSTDKFTNDNSCICFFNIVWSGSVVSVLPPQSRSIQYVTTELPGSERPGSELPGSELPRCPVKGLIHDWIQTCDTDLHSVTANHSKADVPTASFLYFLAVCPSEATVCDVFVVSSVVLFVRRKNISVSCVNPDIQGFMFQQND